MPKSTDVAMLRDRMVGNEEEGKKEKGTRERVQSIGFSELGSDCLSKQISSTSLCADLGNHLR